MSPLTQDASQEIGKAKARRRRLRYRRMLARKDRRLAAMYGKDPHTCAAEIVIASAGRETYYVRRLAEPHEQLILRRYALPFNVEELQHQVKARLPYPVRSGSGSLIFRVHYDGHCCYVPADSPEQARQDFVRVYPHIERNAAEKNFLILVERADAKLFGPSILLDPKVKHCVVEKVPETLAGREAKCILKWGYSGKVTFGSPIHKREQYYGCEDGTFFKPKPRYSLSATFTEKDLTDHDPEQDRLGQLLDAPVFVVTDQLGQTGPTWKQRDGCCDYYTAQTAAEAALHWYKDCDFVWIMDGIYRIQQARRGLASCFSNPTQFDPDPLAPFDPVNAALADRLICILIVG